MIILISEDSFLDNSNKLTKIADFEVLNGTSNDRITRISSYDDVDFFKENLTPNKKAFEDDFEAERFAKKFIKSPQITEVVVQAVTQQLVKGDDSNVFIVLKNKVANKFAAKLTKRMCKIVELDEDESLFINFESDKANVFTCDSPDKVIEKEIKKLDENIDDLVEEYNSINDSYWGVVDDDEAKKLKKKIKKLRNRRKELASGVEDGSAAITDSIKIQVIKKAKISKSTKSKMRDLIENWKSKKDEERGSYNRSARYDTEDDD